jgi:hypothetical protein
MPPVPALTDIAHVIQLSIAPVFLLTSIGTILSVLSARLARVVDRSRVLNDRVPGAPEATREPIRLEVRLLIRRRGLVNQAITFGTTAALLVCLLIASAFIGALLNFNVSVLVAALFILAMFAFIGTLLSFLREVMLATRSVDNELR